MQWLLLAFLTSIAGLAAVAVAQRTKPSGRAELALSTCILWNAIVGCPIYALGLTAHLTARALGFTSAIFSLGVLAIALAAEPARSARELAAGVIDLIALPFDGIGRASRARSVVVLALLLTAILIPYTAFASYFTPSWRQWDALWYHEPIVGFTIQTHSFAPVTLPDDTQKVNGYPRFCEMIQLWFVIFTDRRLIELPNSLMAPGFMYATYLIARRYSRDVVSCMAWAAVAMIMPNASYLLQSTYIDLHVALFVLAGTYYATRPVFRLADAWLASVCIALSIGSKYLALPAAGIILLIALVRLLLQNGVGPKSLGTLFGGALLIAGMSAEVFWRNWKHFKNPLWPDFQYDDPVRGIHIPGLSFGGANPLDMNMPYKDLFDALYSVPYSVGGLGPKGQVFDYGFAVIWIVFPLSALALVVAFFLSMRDLVGQITRAESWRVPDAFNPILVALPVAAQIWMSPALWSGRYHIANVGALAGVVAFLGGRARWQAFGEGAAAAAAVASLVVFYWVKPRWIWLPDELMQLAAIPYPAREATPASDISHTLDIHSGSPVTREIGLARERLKPGEIYASDYTQFPAMMWNNTFSNRVVIVPGGAGYLDRVNAIGARFANCQNGTPHCAELVAACAGPNPTWKDIGTYNVENWSRVYERLTP